MFWIHKGMQPLGAALGDVLIHTGQSVESVRDGILEETLVHEAAHAALDGRHEAAEGWLAAQQADPTFISTYTRDNPTRGDIAESFLAWLALRYRRDRVDDAYAATVEQAIPNRPPTFLIDPAVEPYLAHLLAARTRGDPLPALT